MHTLSLDARPLSMQIILQCGAAAFTWKTAFDEEFSDFSPGMLLFEDYTAVLLVDPTVAYVDSCAYDRDSFMAAWTESQCIGNLWFDVRAGGSLRTEILARTQMRYRALRDIAKERSALIRRAWRR
jgi:CelD/BcsL family acetyltransferase involved in cellulose biosynthesis